jgi:hypothetical protein
MNEKTCAFNNGRQNFFVCNSLVKYLYFIRWISALASLVAQIFLLVKKVLLTCYINNYFSTACAKNNENKYDTICEKKKNKENTNKMSK